MAIALPFGITLSRERALPLPPTAVAPEPSDREAIRDRNARPEIGATGTMAISGFLDSEEYDKDLRGEKAITTFTRMRNDGMVQAMLNSIVLPLRGAIPKFNPPTDNPDDKRIAEACDVALLNMRGSLWDDYVRQTFTGSLQFGHSVFEPVWVDADERPNYIDVNGDLLLAPYKMAPRLQKTLWRWHIDKVGGLRGIQQRTWVSDIPTNAKVEAGDTNGRYTLAAGGSWHYIDLPINRIMYFGLDVEGSNFLGRSALRAAYKNWFHKNILLAVETASAERHGLGVPYAVVKQGISTREETAITDALRYLHAHEQGYLLLSENQLASAAVLGMPPVGILDMRAGGTRRSGDTILYHDRQMALSILADFLTIGGQTSTNNTHRDKTSIFFNALEGYKRPWEAAYQAQIVKPFVDMNFGPQKEYPSFGLTSLATKDSLALANALSSLATSRLLTPSAEIEQVIREQNDLPELPVDEHGKPMYDTPATDPDDPNADPAPNPGQPPLPGDAATATEDVQRTALNGAQIAALLEVVTQVSSKDLAPDAAKVMLAASFPSMSPDEIERMVSAATAFTPPPKPAPAPFGGGAPNPFSKEVPARQLSEPPGSARAKVLQAAAIAAMKRKAALLADREDDYDTEEFTDDSHNALFYAFLSAFLAGALVNGSPARGATTVGTAWASSAADAQLPHLRNFATQIASGALSQAAVDARIGQYAAKTWAGFERGRSAAAPDGARIIWHTEDDHACDLCDPRDGVTFTRDDLPGFPGDGDFGEICEGAANCRCWLEYVADGEDA